MLSSAAGRVLEVPELRCTRNGHTALLREAPCAVGGPERSTSPTKGHSESLSSAGSALRTPQPAPRRLALSHGPRLTCPRRIRQPLDRSHQAPLEKFPNFFAALHALASDRPHESQQEETARAHAPGLRAHPRCPSHSFPRRGPHSPRAPRAADAGKASAVRSGGGRESGSSETPASPSPKVPRDRPRCSRAERRRVSLSGGSEMARCEPGQRLEPHGACEHSALATGAVAEGCTASCQPETRPRVALRGRPRPGSVDRPRPVVKPRPRATPRAAPAPRLSRCPRGPGWRNTRAALPEARKRNETEPPSPHPFLGPTV